MQRHNAILAVPLAVALLACGYSNDHRDQHHHDDFVDDPPVEQPAEVAESTIDTGATMGEIVPGEGVGAFVEYYGGGSWRVYLACDTEISKYRCDWDVLVTPLAGELEYLDAHELEDNDYVDWVDDGLNLIATNTTDFDGFDFAASPGAGVRVDVFLDGVPAGRYIYWVGDGGLHRGAPTNPIDLIPSTP